MPFTPPDPAPLTGAEHAILASISTHEHRTDPRFADALAAGVVPRSVRFRPVRLLTVAVVVTMVAGLLVLSTAWLLAVAAVALLVVVPTGLVIWALRQGRVDPDAVTP